MDKVKPQREYAKVCVSKEVTKVAHVCSCDNSCPSFEGEVAGNSISWPVAFGRYRISYCPWCGLKLPLELNKPGSLK